MKKKENIAGKILSRCMPIKKSSKKTNIEDFLGGKKLKKKKCELITFDEFMKKNHYIENKSEY